MHVYFISFCVSSSRSPNRSQTIEVGRLNLNGEKYEFYVCEQMIKSIRSKCVYIYLDICFTCFLSISPCFVFRFPF